MKASIRLLLATAAVLACDPPDITPVRTPNPDRVWCDVKALNCPSGCVTNDGAGKPQWCGKATNDDGLCRHAAELAGPQPQTGPEGQWTCFDSQHQFAHQACEALCNKLDSALHPDPFFGNGCTATVNTTGKTHPPGQELGACQKEMLTNSLTIGGTDKPDFAATLAGAGTVVVNGTTFNPNLKTGLLSIKSKDISCGASVDASQPGTCDVQLSNLSVTYHDFSYQGVAIQRLTVTNSDRLLPTDAVRQAGQTRIAFSIPANTTFFASSIVDGDSMSMPVTSTHVSHGVFDPSTGVGTVSVNFAGAAGSNQFSGMTFATSDELQDRAPLPNAGPNQSVSTGPLACAADVVLDGSATVDLDNNPMVISWSEGMKQFGDGQSLTVSLELGSHQVDMYARDPKGAGSVGLVNVNVFDGTPPIFTEPPVAREVATCQNPDIGTPKAADNCSIPSVTSDKPSVYPPATTTIVHWKATDQASNETPANQAVTVKDTTPPVLGPVPSDRTRTACGPVDLGPQPTATDDCAGVPTVENDAPTSFPAGPTKVTWTAKDAAGNTAKGTQWVTINDTTPPSFTTVPGAVTISKCVGWTIGQPTATDSCGVTITSDAPVKFPLGTTTVTWTATDGAGNKKTATQKVTAVLGDDTSCCPAGSNIMVGTNASDQLVGTSGSDFIIGKGGDDVIDARDGNDHVSGGAGRDQNRQRQRQ